MDSITLKPEHATKMRELMAKQQALKLFVEQIMQQGERRGQSLLEESQKFWQEIIAKDPDYKIDLKTVTYEPTPDGNQLQPVMQRFK